MRTFTICPCQGTTIRNHYLNSRIQGFYHSDYFGNQGRWKEEGTIECLICTLKNDITPYPQSVLDEAVQRLSNILSVDLPKLLNSLSIDNLTVCVIPRAKVNYNPNQLLFKSTISNVVSQLKGFYDGTNFISRHTDTRTTHRNRAGYGGNGDMPYPGITQATCKISNNVAGKDILLIDDLYTKEVYIDEDAIQALLNVGARSVYFYSIGRTV